jgi:fructoselysine-6-P-deglycase FrlB-like protein
VASALAAVDRLLVVGSGADRTSARELALKVEEGVHLPATAYELETLLHGHLAAANERTGLVLLLAEPRARPERVARARGALAAVREIGVPTALLVAESALEEFDPSLVTAGRIPLPEAPGLPAPVAALLGAAVPFQLLTERLARVRGVNPDTLRRTEAPYARSAERYE